MVDVRVFVSHMDICLLQMLQIQTKSHLFTVCFMMRTKLI